jgi:hypothetical protein
MAPWRPPLRFPSNKRHTLAAFAECFVNRYRPDVGSSADRLHFCKQQAFMPVCGSPGQFLRYGNGRLGQRALLAARAEAPEVMAGTAS